MNEYTFQIQSPLVNSDEKPIINKSTRNINLVPANTLKYLLSIIFFLLIAHLLGAIVQEVFPQQLRVHQLLTKFFHLDKESNFPTFFSAVQLFAASLLLFFIGYLQNSPQSNKIRKSWYFLGIIFLFLSFDEATLIHEELMKTMRSRLTDLPSILYYAWVIPYFILVVGIGAYLFKFLFSLPPKTRNLFFFSGFLFVFGAIGLEIFEGYTEKLYGKANLTYFALITVEELLEMVSISIFIYALLDYLTPLHINLSLKKREN